MSYLTSTAERCIERTIRLVKVTEILSRLLIDALGIVAETEWNHRFVNQLPNEFRYELRVCDKDLREGADRLSQSLSRRRTPTSGGISSLQTPDDFLT